jgi:uroporphyrinogen decarboxylase
VPYLYETLRGVARALDGRVPLIGFAAAPFTLAVYLIEGRGPRSFERTKALLYSDPRTAQRLLERIAALTERYVAAQVAAGAQAIQLFDTWAGMLDRPDFREFALRWARELFERLSGTGVPRIYFALDAAHLLPDLAGCGADVVSLDWRVDLASASAALGHRFVLQGNLDACALFAPPAELARRARAVLEAGRAAPGHLFNLGHGVLPDTPVENLEALVRLVQSESSRAEAAR